MLKSFCKQKIKLMKLLEKLKRKGKITKKINFLYDKLNKYREKKLQEARVAAERDIAIFRQD